MKIKMCVKYFASLFASLLILAIFFNLDNKNQFLSSEQYMYSIPIVIYENVVLDSEQFSKNKNAITLEQFLLQIKHLQNSGYTPILLSQYNDIISCKTYIEKPILIILNGGDKEIYSILYDKLVKDGIKINIFLDANSIKNNNDSYLILNEVINMINSKDVEIGLKVDQDSLASNIDIVNKIEKDRKYLEGAISKNIFALAYKTHDKYSNNLKKVLNFSNFEFVFTGDSLFINKLSYRIKQIAANKYATISSFGEAVDVSYNRYISTLKCKTRKMMNVTNFYPAIIVYRHVLPENKISVSNKKYSITVKNFEKQMEMLSKEGYTTLLMNEFEEIMLGIREPVPKPVIIMFDDGYESVYNYAFPILKKYNLKANVMIITKYLIQENKDHLKMSQIKEMLDSGLIEIGSNTVNHINLNNLTDDEIKQEIVASFWHIYNYIGVKPIGISYPGGKVPEKVSQIVKDSGYMLGFINEYKGENSIRDRYLLQRIIVTPSMSEDTLKAKIIKHYINVNY